LSLSKESSVQLGGGKALTVFVYFLLVGRRIKSGRRPASPGGRNDSLQEPGRCVITRYSVLALISSQSKEFSKVLYRRFIITLLISLVILSLACNRKSKTTHNVLGQETTPIADNSAEVTVTLPFFHRLDENYLRGGEPKRGGIEILRRLGVKAIVDLRSDYDHTDELGIAAERSGLQYYRIPLSVWDPPADQEAKEFVDLVMDRTKGPFYVFCTDGVNRVGEMSAIYRVANSQWTVAQALKEIDDMGFSPYYWSLRAYVYTYARKFHPHALPPRARSLSSSEM
jgi:protein tyrosine phosphatase (PTP) superfamily phosphohydrolase (DUF442 family)